LRQRRIISSLDNMADSREREASLRMTRTRTGLSIRDAERARELNRANRPLCCRSLDFTQLYRKNTMIGKKKWLLSGCVVTILAASVALPQTAVAAEDGLHSEVTIYGWMKSLEGTTGDADISLNFFQDILDNLDAALMLRYEAQIGRWAFYADYQYADVGIDHKLSGSFDFGLPPSGSPIITVNASGKVQATDIQKELELGAAYSFYDHEDMNWQVVGGARFFDYQTDVKIKNIQLNLENLPNPIDIPARKTTIGDDWAQGFLGVRFASQVSEKWRLRGRYDYGYGGSDNHSWLTEFLMDYRITDWGSIEFGYRIHDITYDSNSQKKGFSYDVKEQGPRVGFIFFF
jgi:hypothetical protein